MSQSLASVEPPPTEPPAAAEGSQAKKIEGRSPWRLGMERLVRDRASMISLGVIVIIVLVAIFAPVIAAIVGHGPNQQFNAIGLTAIGQPKGPSSTFLLGTDDLGRDIMVRIAYGARISLIVGVVATALTVAVGAVVGLIAGYFGGATDSILARFMDWLLAVPFLLFAISLVTIIGAGLTVVIIVIGFFGWASVGRIVRGQVLSLKEREFIQAAVGVGVSDMRIIRKDILPNILPAIIVYFPLMVALGMLTESALSFLSIGVQPPQASWGTIINDGMSLLYNRPAVAIAPGVLLVITTVALNLLGDSVRDALDPRVRLRGSV